METSTQSSHRFTFANYLLILSIIVVVFVFLNRYDDTKVIENKIQEHIKTIDSANVQLEIKNDKLQKEKVIIINELEQAKTEKQNEKENVSNLQDSSAVKYFNTYIDNYILTNKNS